MLTKRELEQIEHLKADNCTWKHIFDKIEQERQYERSLIDHNIRNQLTLITGSIPFVETATPELHDSKYWNYCIAGTKRLCHFLDQLSEYHQSTSIHSKPIHLDSLLTDLIQSCPCKACPNAASLTLKIHHSSPVAYGDSQKLTYALQLLLHKCCDSLPERKPELLLSLSRLDAYHRITISANHQPSANHGSQDIWFPDTFQDNHDNDLDLELCIANNIIRSHGGFIKPMQIQTAHGSRAKLNIYLPS